MTRTLTILRPGAQALVQDLGRPGHGAMGVAHCGAADQTSLRIGNRLVGNADTDAGLELALGGAEVRFDARATIACTGACGSLVSAHGGGERAIPPWRPVDVDAGAVLRVGAPADGARTYLCVAGGIATRRVLGSRAAHASTGLGGGALGPGESVPLGERGSMCAGPASRADLTDLIRSLASRRLRVVPDPLEGTLADGVFEVLAQSDRMGLRLRTGVSVPSDADGASMRTVGAWWGAIQLLPDGGLIVLGPDCAPTGGYPIVASVILADLDALGQRRAGDVLRFEPVTREHAVGLQLEHEALRDRSVAPARARKEEGVHA